MRVFKCQRSSTHTYLSQSLLTGHARMVNTHWPRATCITLTTHSAQFTRALSTRLGKLQVARVLYLRQCSGQSKLQSTACALHPQVTLAGQPCWLPCVYNATSIADRGALVGCEANVLQLYFQWPKQPEASTVSARKTCRTAES